MAQLQPGDHIRVSRGAYHHHAIYWGNNQVVHFTDVRPSKLDAKIRFGTLVEFAGPSGLSGIEHVPYGRCAPTSEVLWRAHSRIGAGSYHLFQNNCEHFARWCKTGHHVSVQSDAAISTGGGVTGVAATTSAAIGVVSAAGMVGTSGPGVLSGLASVGDLVGGGAVAGVVTLAAAPIAVATIATHHAFRDDPVLSASERYARRAGRQGTLVGAGVGALASLAAISVTGTVRGLSGAGIASGLSALGAGRMKRGVVVAVAAPAAIAACIGYLAYRSAKAPSRV